MTREAAESLAIQALAFLAGEPERIGRFLAVSGIGPDRIRAAAHDPDFLAGVLDYLACEEAVLIAFATEADINPFDIPVARDILNRERSE